MGASQSEPDAPTNAAPEKEPALPPPPPPRKGLFERGAHKVHKRGAAAYAASPSASEAGGAAWKGLVNLTDSSSPLSVRTSPLPLKLCMMLTLFCAFSGAFVYMALNNTEYCNEENGCRVCSILDVESVKAADYEDDMKWELGFRTQQLTTSCAEVTLNPANEEAINKIALSDAELATIKDDLYQMNRLFSANTCGYYRDCNHAAWKTCDGGAGDSAYVFDSVETDDKETREVLETIFKKLEGQLRVRGHLKYEKETRIWSGIDVGARRMENHMEYDDAKPGLEAVAIKEALAMSCILRSLWVVSGRIYVMMKINTFFGHNSCERFDDGIRVSEELVRKVTDLFEAEGRDIHTNLIERMIESFYEVAAFTAKLLFPSLPMDEGVGDLLLQTMELSERAGVSVPPALAQRTPRFQKMHFPGGSGDSEMEEAVRSRAEAAAADAAGQGTEAAADHLNDAYGDGDGDPEDPEEPSDD